MKVKTYKQWEKSNLDLDVFLKPGDLIDEAIYMYLGECVPPNFCSYGFVQCGEAQIRKYDTFFYMTAMQLPDSKYMYLGILPEFKN